MSEHITDVIHQVPLLKATQVSQILNISRAKAYQLMQTGELHTVKIGAARRVRPQDLEKFILQNLTGRNSRK